MDSRDAYSVMVSFAQKLPEGRFKSQVFTVLDNSKPFRNFKNLIDASSWREEWFAHQDKVAEEHVEEQLKEYEAEQADDA